MHTIGMNMQQVQVNTKFLNALPSEWSKFITDVKLAKSLYTTNYDQLYAYISQHERHANEVRIMRERYLDPLAFIANSLTLYNPSQSPQHSVNPQQHPVSPPSFISPLVTQQCQAEFPQLDSSPVVPMFQQGEDLIECINKAMANLSLVASRFPPSNNQLRTTSNPRNQATIQDGRVTVQQVQGRQNQSYAGTGNRGIATALKENVAAEIDVSRSSGSGSDLDEEQLAFLADPGISEALVAHCDPKVLYEVSYSNSYPNDMINQDMQEMQYSEQTHVDDFQDNEIHSASNIISYSQYLQESQDVVIQDTNPSAPNDLSVLSLVEQMTDHIAHLDKENQTNKMVDESLTAELERYKERIAIFEQRLNVDLNKREKIIDSQMDDLIRDKNVKLAAFQQEIDTLKETLSNNVKEKESLSKTLTVFKTESKEKESKYIDKEIVLKKQNKELENIICKMYQSTIIAKEHDVIFVIDDEETLILEEESRSKMLDKQNDPISIENKIKISLIDYSKLNKIKEYFGKRFVTQKELSAEQAFWLKHSSLSETPVNSHTLVRIKAPSELPKLSFVNESLKKLKYQLANFDKVSLENSVLNAQLQEKVFAITTLKNELRKLKGKNVVNTVVSKPNATIALGMFKLDIEPISPRLKNNRDAHEGYIEKTILTVFVDL
ncbi:hypothetical protein Tco_1003588 [Tanacetum coccineum]|uniref:Integrase, catalytic region, zinc finger, CCHC-type, peptidase aspartic, catalytic n=1 Tax=Tanacetum coccineum TaxID=301880 RepID=A0ABQ5F9R3_9ASTR